MNPTPTPTPGGPIPMTAWEQAVVVVLFALAFAWILNWFGKQLKAQRESHKELQTSWQHAIREMNQRWQDFLHEEGMARSVQRKEDRQRVDELHQALTELAKMVAQFREDFQAHVISEDARMDVLLTQPQREAVAARVRKARKDGSKP